MMAVRDGQIEDLFGVSSRMNEGDDRAGSTSLFITDKPIDQTAFWKDGERRGSASETAGLLMIKKTPLNQGVVGG